MNLLKVAFASDGVRRHAAMNATTVALRYCAVAFLGSRFHISRAHAGYLVVNHNLTPVKPFLTLRTSVLMHINALLDAHGADVSSCWCCCHVSCGAKSLAKGPFLQFDL